MALKWFKHDGGECPVDPHIMVAKTKLRGGVENDYEAPVWQYRWEWGSGHRDFDILEYALDIQEPVPATSSKSIYLIGSLRNDGIPSLGNTLRDAGHNVFDDWFAAGPEADDYWLKYEKERGRSYQEALSGKAAKNVFAFDKANLEAADVAILVLPAGKSAHLELGWMAGKGKKTIVFMPEEPERWDVMYQFADHVVVGVEELLECLK